MPGCRHTSAGLESVGCEARDAHGGMPGTMRTTHRVRTAGAGRRRDYRGLLIIYGAAALLVGTTILPRRLQEWTPEGLMLFVVLHLLVLPSVVGVIYYEMRFLIRRGRQTWHAVPVARDRDGDDLVRRHASRPAGRWSGRRVGEPRGDVLRLGRGDAAGTSRPVAG